MKNLRIALYCFGGCFFAGLWVAFHWQRALLIAIAVSVALALWGVCYRRKNFGLSAVSYSCLAALVVAFLVGENQLNRMEKLLLTYGGKEVPVTALVSDVFLQEENRCGILLKDCLLPGGEKATVVAYGFGDFTCEEGERISALLQVQPFFPTDSQMGKGAMCTGIISSLQRLEGPSKFRSVINDLYIHMKINIKANILGQEGSLFAAILLGDRESIPADLENSFRLSGISHLLCISGLHLLLLAALVRLILFPLLGRRPVGEIFVALFIFSYLFCIGFPPAACRAALLLLFSSVGKLFYRKGDSLMILSLSVTMMLLFSPSLANSLSFQLSVAAVAGLELLEPVLRKLLFGADASRGYTLLTTPLGVAVAVFPWSALIFGYFSLGGIAATIFAVPLMTPILASGLFAAFFSGSIGSFFGKLCRLLLLLVEWIADFFSFCILPLREGFVAAGLLLSAAVLVLGFLLKRKKLSFCLSSLLLVASLLCSAAFWNSRITVTQFCGEDAASVVIAKGHSAVVVAMGSGMEESVTAYLRGRGINCIDCLILPSDSQKTSADCWDFSQKNKVAAVMASKENRYGTQAAEQTAFLELLPGHFSIFSEQAELRTGKHGYALLLTVKGERIAILPEDFVALPDVDRVIYYSF